ncbi:hypothetical protein MBLNU457_7064t1 [Dothideomycetes sp. NU457]
MAGQSNPMASSAQDKHPKYSVYGTYFSPPEVPLSDAFSNSQSPMKQPIATASTHRRLPSMSSLFQTLSPPISPHTKLDKEPGYKDVAVSGGAVKDPVLFPSAAQSGLPSSHASGPLFDGISAEQRILDPIEEHIRKRRRIGRDGYPTRADYELTLSSLSKLVNSYTSGPKQYISNQLEELEEYVARGARHAGVKRSASSQQSGSTAIVKRARTARKAPVEKLPPAKRVRVSPREKLQTSFDAEVAFEPERKDSTTAARKQSKEPKEPKEHKEDADFSSLPDYSPPMSSLADNAKALKTEWRGNPLDLSQDPHKHLLHPAELALAATLRLSCAMFICTKRRIFAARREYFHDGRDFNKTAAQQACKIDVNKASKLWTAFDKVGWFDKKWVV